MVLLVAGRSIGIRDRILVQEGFHPGSPRDFRSLIRNVFIFTFSIEFIGFILLFLGFAASHPLSRAAASAFFHSVSAFCNAGFSVYSDSLMSFRGNILVNLTVIGLVVLGGLGFLVIQEVLKVVRAALKKEKTRLSLHTKLVLLATLFLIAGGFLLFFFLEARGSLDGLTGKEKILACLFQVVTPRTAGFNTLDLTSLGTATVMLMMMLMFIGASPGSTGGGVKTSTFGVILAFIRSRIAGRDSVHLFYRNVPAENITRAFSVVLLALSLIFVVSFVVLLNQPGTQMREVVFEVVSAFGTVGLSLGITPELSPLSKLMLILTMYAGRVGPLTLLYAFSRRRAAGKFEYVEENVMIG